MIDIKGIDKAKLLVGLYNNSHQQGLGMLQPAKELTVEDAKKLLENITYFDYLYGKVMKVDLSSDEEFEERLYDLDNGKGTALTVVNKLRKMELADDTENKLDDDSLNGKTSNNNSLNDFDSIFTVLNEISIELKTYYKNMSSKEDNTANIITKDNIITKFKSIIDSIDVLNNEMGPYEFIHLKEGLSSFYESIIEERIDYDILIQSYDSFIKECVEDKKAKKDDKVSVEKKYEGMHKATNYMNYLNNGNPRNMDMENELENFGFIINSTSGAIQSKDYRPFDDKRIRFISQDEFQRNDNEQNITIDKSVRDVRTLKYQKMLLQKKLEEKVRRTGSITEEEKKLYNKLNDELKSLADGKKSIVKFIYYCYKMNSIIKKGYKLCDNKNNRIVDETKSRNR